MMDTPGNNQPGLNISFNPMSSGSIAATNSSGYTAVNSEDTDPELSYSSSLAPQSYDHGPQVKSYQFHHSSPTTVTQNRIWNSRSNNTNSPGLGSPASMMNNMVSMPRSDNQGIHLPSFMNNSVFDASARQSNSGSTAHVNHFNPVDYGNISTMKLGPKEQMTSVQEFGSFGQSMPNQIMANYGRKKQLSINPDVPSYNSSLASVSSFDNRSSSSDARANSQISIEKGNMQTYSGSSIYEASESETIEMLKSELSFKSQLNDSLKEKLRSIEPEEEVINSEEDMKLPKNYVQLFRDLTYTLNEKTKELKETKSKIEAIVVGTLMTRESSFDNCGSFDAQDIAHKITNKLSLLQTENEALLNMVSYSNKQSLLIELGLMKNEVKALKEKLDMKGSEG